MVDSSMFFGGSCPKCEYTKLNVIKELESNKYKCDMKTVKV